MGVTGGDSGGVGTPKHRLSSSQLQFLSDPLAPVRAFTITHPGLSGSQPKLSYSNSNGSDHSHVRVDFTSRGSSEGINNGGHAAVNGNATNASGASRTSLAVNGRKSKSFSKGDLHQNKEIFNLTLDFPHHKASNGNGTLDFPHIKFNGNGHPKNTLDHPHSRSNHVNASPGHRRRKDSSNVVDFQNKLNFSLSTSDQTDPVVGSPISNHSNYGPSNDSFLPSSQSAGNSHPPKAPNQQRKISNRSLHGVFHSRLSGPLASLQPVPPSGLARPQTTRARKKRHSAMAFFNSKDKENVQIDFSPSSSPSNDPLSQNMPSVLQHLASTISRPGANDTSLSNGSRLLGQGLSLSENSLGPGGLSYETGSRRTDDNEVGRARKVSIALRALAGRLSLSLGKGDGFTTGGMAAPATPAAKMPRPIFGIPSHPHGGGGSCSSNSSNSNDSTDSGTPPLPPPNLPPALMPLTATLSGVSSASSSSNGGVGAPLSNGLTADMPQKRMVRAMYDYKAAQKGDLSLVQDEEYEVLEETEEHWWKLRDKHGNEGYSPSNYVKESTDVGLHQYDWYLGDATRQRAETILMREEREGCFVVRNSSSTTGMYTISVYCSMSRPQVKHYHIQKDSEGKYYLSHNIKCSSISELIYKHQYNPGGLCTRLRSAPLGNKPPATAGFSRDKWDIPLNEITLLEEIGSGQFGVVRRGKYRGMDVAVKMMKEGTMSEDEFIEEAKVMTKLQHPNLVQLYGVCKRQRPVYIITEFLEYGSLLHYLRQKEKVLSAKTDTLIDMCLQICEGMAYLEKEKFIHRDLAARNCLVGSKNIKVGDFGLARYVVDDEYTGSGGAKFPIKWAAPEVLNYMRFSSKSDVWAFGVLMWEVFTCGKMPYGRRKNADVVAMVQEGVVLDQPRYCPHNVYQVMRECWEQSADQRPSFHDLKVEIGRLNAED